MSSIPQKQAVINYKRVMGFARLAWASESSGIKEDIRDDKQPAGQVRWNSSSNDPGERGREKQGMEICGEIFFEGISCAPTLRNKLLIRNSL